MRMRLAVLAALLLAASGAGAADLEGELRRCSEIGDSLVRLNCYDALAKGNSAPSASRASTTQNAASGQCEGITKKGRQCSRRAKPGSRYCYQHGG